MISLKKSLQPELATLYSKIERQIMYQAKISTLVKEPWTTFMHLHIYIPISLLLALFVSRMASQITTQMIEFHQKESFQRTSKEIGENDVSLFKKIAHDMKML